VAHFHYVMMGGVAFAFVGGLYYWWPKITGRMFDEKVANIGAVLMFIGFNTTFFTQFLLGFKGMPRRYFDYDPEFAGLHAFSSVGSWILGLGFLVALINFVQSLRKGEIAPANPWGGTTLEWTTSSPPPPHNFVDTPTVSAGPYDREHAPAETGRAAA